MNTIRNFSIIAHVDHGKSTLADRMIEVTKTVEKRKMREQVLDGMELERERGITIKMTPVRMDYELDSKKYILNLIDTPGHIDFSYEVSRSLKAVEGAILLIDATQGVQAQTMTTLEFAKEMNLVIVPVISKIDSQYARIEETLNEVSDLLGCSKEDIVLVSGKTGEGVEELLSTLIKKIPPPSRTIEDDKAQALVFDYEYSIHRGIIMYVRVFKGVFETGANLLFRVTKETCIATELGYLSPTQNPSKELREGEIGYIVTGIKEPGKAIIGDTITYSKNPSEALAGYKNPLPVVWASLYPESQDDFLNLKNALLRLKLSDSSLSFEEELSPSLGRGFRCGFLGMLHLEIVAERLKREFEMELIITTPSIVYEVVYKNNKKEKIYTPAHFPDHGAYEEIFEPWVLVSIITPSQFTGDILQLLYKHEAEVGDSSVFGKDRITLTASMPLRELMRGFFDALKNVSSGFASLSYTFADTRKADVVRLDVLIAEEPVPAFSRIVSSKKVNEEAKQLVERVYKAMPRQLFALKIQGKAKGRILSSKTLSALRKDVTGHLYGGDITRKRKLWEKQKKGKKKLREQAKVSIPHDVFLKVVKQ